MQAHIYFPVHICVAYDVEIPDGMTVGDVAQGLFGSKSFYKEHLYPDLSCADWHFDDIDWDDWVDEPDFTAEQVLTYIKE